MSRRRLMIDVTRREFVGTSAATDWAHGLTDPVDPLVARITLNVLDRLTG